MIIKGLLYKRLLLYVVITILAIITIFPVIFIVTNSFMNEDEVFTTYNIFNNNQEKNIGEGINKEYAKIVLIPEKVSLLQYYHALLRKPNFIIMFWNSVTFTVPILFGQILVSSLGGYAFAKLRFPLREPIFFLFIIVMLMPYQVTLVPNYIILDKLNLIGSYLSIILPGVFSAFGVFLLRQFIKGIPDEFVEAARMDGAGHIGAFFYIIAPQCKGGIASLAILSFIDNWNMVEQPLIFIKDSYKYPLSVYLSFINESDMGIAFACGLLFMLPAVLVYIYGEDYLVEGVQLSGIK